MKPLGPPSRIAVGSGAGGLPFTERGSSSSARPRSSRVWRNWRTGLKVGCASGASRRSSAISCLPSRNVRVATFDVSPSESTAGRDASANGPRRVKNSSRCGAARCMSASSGVCSSASSPSRAMVGLSSSRKVGSFWKVRSSSARRVAVISAVSPASSTQRTTSRLFCSSSSITVSESAMKSLMTWFWPPRISSTREVSRRPGWARRSASERSSGRPARPVPSVVTIRRKRSR